MIIELLVTVVVTDSEVRCQSRCRGGPVQGRTGAGSVLRSGPASDHGILSWLAEARPAGRGRGPAGVLWPRLKMPGQAGSGPGPAVRAWPAACQAAWPFGGSRWAGSVWTRRLMPAPRPYLRLLGLGISRIAKKCDGSRQY